MDNDKYMDSTAVINVKKLKKIDIYNKRYIQIMREISAKAKTIEELYKKGGKKKIIDRDTEMLIIGINDTHPLLGLMAIENYFIDSGIKVSHNIIYRVLLKYGMVDQSKNTKKQRKYVKYERKYSNTL